jgi:hypothetical protein
LTDIRRRTVAPQSAANLTLPTGKMLFVGSSGTGASYEFITDR